MLRKIRNKIQKKKYVIFHRRKFRQCDKSVKIFSPLKMDGRKYISLHKNVTIHYKTWLEASEVTGNKPEIIIEEGSTVGRFNHIYATEKIHIGKNVLTADKIYISDNQHQYEDINTPIIKQPIKQLKAVSIGDGSWIGEGACIMGATVGKQCVIGANAVVTKDIPDYCIAVGIPAKIIKRYDRDKKIWRKTNSKGEFIDE